MENSIGMNMITVKTDGERVPNDYMMAQTQVTQAQWREVMSTDPSCFNGDNLPVEFVSWIDCLHFCNKLSDIEDLMRCYIIGDNEVVLDEDADGYRLPTELEWEWAARGGWNTHGYEYAGSNDLTEVGWYYDNSDGRTHPVAQLKPNELGFYDMSGNVWEWCWDEYELSYVGFEDKVKQIIESRIPLSVAEASSLQGLKCPKCGAHLCANVEVEIHEA